MTGDLFAMEGAAAAASHADRVHGDWRGRAMACLRAVGPLLGEFQAEDVRLHVERSGALPSAPDGRAWGMVIREARDAGLIEAAGVRPVRNPRAHCRPMVVWRWKGAA